MNLRITHDNDHHHEPEEEAIEETIRKPSLIFDANYSGEDVPQGFDSVLVSLNGAIKSTLDWTQEIAAAERYRSQGHRIFWNLDMGLFSELSYPLLDQGQFQSLVLSLEFFRDTIWSQFQKDSVGVCLYRGPAYFGQSTSEVNNYNEYLELLSQRLPSTIPRYILLDASHIEEPMTRAKVLSKERYFHLIIGVKGARGCGGELGWNDKPLSFGFLGRTLPTEIYVPPKIGVCLPSLDHIDDDFRKVISQVKDEFQVIPESHLTISWDGLDVIHACEKKLTPQGRRMLKGFEAAGGTVILS